jgi:hypothetical protein
MSVLTMWLITVSLLLTPCLISAREIRQEVFAHIDGSVRLPASPTFLVTGSPRVNRLACDQGPGNAKTACQIAVVQFALASAETAEEEVNQLLKSLKACAVSTGSSLVVTGHACIFGDEPGNLELSRTRARNVASSLEAHGYTVGRVEGAPWRQSGSEPASGGGPRQTIAHRQPWAIPNPQNGGEHLETHDIFLQSSDQDHLGRGRDGPPPGGQQRGDDRAGRGVFCL